ncbi:hypothetical protein KIN20_028337 [Parelaphostrongylus tenuis]|uniref:Uncharacterized protein n=1 Tax=Parelaphostrongylus tenuis TaxID=148309 RepID=A0AAD5R143_PARTN|nr:hypothetical protein KIN20_028337 [Parelaphostrongylus tenuis]
MEINRTAITKTSSHIKWSGKCYAQMRGLAMGQRLVPLNWRLLLLSKVETPESEHMRAAPELLLDMAMMCNSLNHDSILHELQTNRPNKAKRM